MPITGSCCIRCRTLSLLPACFIASRLFSHSIGRRRACPLSALRLAGRGGLSSRFVVSLFNRIFDVASAACLSSSMPSPWFHLVVRCCPACPACLRIVSPLPSHLIGVSSHRSSSRSSSPRSSTRLAGREAGSVGVLLAWLLPCCLCRCR